MVPLSAASSQAATLNRRRSSRTHNVRSNSQRVSQTVRPGILPRPYFSFVWMRFKRRACGSAARLRLAHQPRRGASETSAGSGRSSCSRCACRRAACQHAVSRHPGAASRRCEQPCCHGCADDPNGARRCGDRHCEVLHHGAVLRCEGHRYVGHRYGAPHALDRRCGAYRHRDPRRGAGRGRRHSGDRCEVRHVLARHCEGDRRRGSKAYFSACPDASRSVAPACDRNAGRLSDDLRAA